jgi:hypothetical protein
MEQNFLEIYQNYNKELKPFLRLDEELFDLLVTSPIKSMDYILNRDISIFFKPYASFSLAFIEGKLKQAEKYFDFFYLHLEDSFKHQDIIIPMVRYYLFLGCSRKIFNIFIEYHKKRLKNSFIFLVSYFLSKESKDYQTYESFFENFYSEMIVSMFNSDTLFLLFFKKNFDVLKEKHYFSDQLKHSYRDWSKNFDDYRKILFNNWFLINFLVSGNIFTAFQFFLWTKKNDGFRFSQEYFDSWSLKFSIIFIRHHKYQALKYLHHKDFIFYSKEEAYEKIHFFVDPKIDDVNQKNEYIKNLIFEFNLYDYYKILHTYFEEIMLTGIEWQEKLNDYSVDTKYIWQILEEVMKNLSLRENIIKSYFEKKTLQEKELFKLILYIIYKYRKMILFYAGFDPFFKAIVALFYERYQPFISLKLYKGNPHPLVIFRMQHLYKDFPNIDIMNKRYLQIKQNELSNIVNL